MSNPMGLGGKSRGHDLYESYSVLYPSESLMTPLRITLTRTLPTRQLRARLGVFVLYEVGQEIRLELNRRAMESYERKNDLETYIAFMNRNNVSFSINGFQCQNSPYYYTIFSVISQHVQGDCAEECLDKAIEKERLRHQLEVYL